jgi:hypothetical protein
MVRTPQSRAYDALEAVEKLTRKQARHQWRKGRKDLKVAQNLRRAKEATSKAVALYDDVATLGHWLQRDILAVAGPDCSTRRELLDFVVAELRLREGQSESQIRPVRVLLENQGANLLAFAEVLDQELAALATGWQLSEDVLRQLLATGQMPETDSKRWQREASHRQQLGGRYSGLFEAVQELSAGVVRASSLVENVNSRLRSYFFLRRQLGPDYLELLRFFLKNRRLQRSEREERLGKSPAELLFGVEHKHWLEMLGYQRFRRAA